MIIKILRALVALSLFVMLGGCAQVAYNKLSDGWSEHQKLVGMSESDVVACAGRPGQVLAESGKRTLRYGYRLKMMFASVWCVADLHMVNQKVSSISIRSGNPGGFTDGSALCSAAVGRCLGDGTLEQTARNMYGAMSAGRIRGDMDDGAERAESEGSQRRNQGAATFLALMAAGPAGAAALPSPVGTNLQDDDEEDDGPGATGRISSTGSTGTRLDTAKYAASGCKANLSHLDGRLPKYNVRELVNARQAILSENIFEAMARAEGAGYTTARAAKESLDAAKRADGEVDKAKACIRNFSTTPERTIRGLEDGSFRFSGNSIQTLNINESCAAQYVALKYAAVAMREAAVQMACIAASK